VVKRRHMATTLQWCRR